MAGPRFQLAYTADAKRDIAELDGSIRKQLRTALEKKLAVHPLQYGEPLTGVLQGFWSYHFAAHRVIYRVYEERRLVLVCAVGARRAGHRSDVYRHFQTLVAAGKTAQQILAALGEPSRE